MLTPSHGLHREIWYYWTSPGTFRRFLLAIWSYCTGQNINFEGECAASNKQSPPSIDEAIPKSDSWYVTEKDLAFFQYHGLGSGELAGASNWELMMEKDVPNLVHYKAWRRTLPNGKTEYKSITTCPDATAREFADMYLDDAYRPNWDTMIVHHEVLEHGNFADRKQVVRWIRRFPFSFLSDREYTIARRAYERDGVFYGLTKAIDHPRKPKESKIVHIDEFYSMWGIRDVPCPWNSGKPACETVLLHHEDFKIPENLARFAVRHAMWGFLKKMATQVPGFVAARRARCGPHDVDAEAFGAGHEPNPPFHQCSASASSSSMSLVSMASTDSDMSTQSAPCLGSRRVRAKPQKRLARFAAFAVASGVAFMIGRTTSMGNMQPANGDGANKKKRNARSHPHNIRAHPCM